jgi:hypothetical protein
MIGKNRSYTNYNIICFSRAEFHLDVVFFEKFRKISKIYFFEIFRKIGLKKNRFFFRFFSIFFEIFRNFLKTDLNFSIFSKNYFSKNGQRDV